ncbi:MAG: bifunctional adenosylcobinamide kinase/adenosylcobinamide-phosphate guanylyltransferase [Gammaproteobacteria bacterium]|nr:bifunctional adenosylcobinamide kinase/adenosylcobinamide-phosphate guanylyltransferase [Gammaproteobacteria bacterium]
MRHLVLGGARSGKSKFAENLCDSWLNSKRSNSNVVYIATATAGDDEMRQRIQFHQQTRNQDWQLIEEPFYLSDILSKLTRDSIVLIDCLTLWLSNWLCTHDVESFAQEKSAFVDQLLNFQGKIVIVSNEVGSGIVPMGELSRQFSDQAGWLNQAIANIVDKVHLIVAGCPLVLKDKQPLSTDYKPGKDAC